MSSLFLLLWACQAPFGTPRQSLAGDRVAALTVSLPGDGSVVPTAWTVVEGHPYADAPPELAWHWVADAAALEGASTGEASAVGPWPALRPPATPVPQLLGLVATFPSGFVERALLKVPERTLPPIVALELGILPARPLIEAKSEDLEREARLAEVATSSAFVPEGTWARLEARFETEPGEVRTRFMATGGTMLELDARTTDWAPAALVLDDLDVEESTLLEPGAITFLALAVDDRGGNVAYARDVLVGPAPTGVWIGERWLPTDTEAGSGLVAATVVSDDAAPSGIGLVDLDPLPALDGVDPYGTASLPCASPVSGPFEPSWLFDGRCSRPDVVGARVVVQVP